jgi:hypothetical protein
MHCTHPPNPPKSLQLACCHPRTPTRLAQHNSGAPAQHSHQLPTDQHCRPFPPKQGEYDAAMAQYQETLGQLEPSYVIRRYLDAQRIHALTSYLEALHEQGLASAGGPGMAGGWWLVAGGRVWEWVLACVV